MFDDFDRREQQGSPNYNVLPGVILILMILIAVIAHCF
jgi:hypothetical protein